VLYRVVRSELSKRFSGYQARPPQLRRGPDSREHLVNPATVFDVPAFEKVRIVATIACIAFGNDADGFTQGSSTELALKPADPNQGFVSCPLERAILRRIDSMVAAVVAYRSRLAEVEPSWVSLFMERVGLAN
jgi:hypothetical protein